MFKCILYLQISEIPKFKFPLDVSGKKKQEMYLLIFI